MTEDIRATNGLPERPSLDPERLGAAVSAAIAGAADDRGANLLERIFDRVKEMVFEEPPAAPPSLLPLEPDAAPEVPANDWLPLASPPPAPELPLIASRYTADDGGETPETPGD
jgi:hypothetical protein